MENGQWKMENNYESRTNHTVRGVEGGAEEGWILLPDV
jgi:hypothetical protein